MNHKGRTIEDGAYQRCVRCGARRWVLGGSPGPWRFPDDSKWRDDVASFCPITEASKR